MFLFDIWNRRWDRYKYEVREAVSAYLSAIVSLFCFVIMESLFVLISSIYEVLELAFC